MAFLDACSLLEDPLICVDGESRSPSLRYRALSSYLSQAGFRIALVDPAADLEVVLGDNSTSAKQLRRPLESCHYHVTLGAPVAATHPRRAEVHYLGPESFSFGIANSPKPKCSILKTVMPGPGTVRSGQTPAVRGSRGAQEGEPQSSIRKIERVRFSEEETRGAATIADNLAHAVKKSMAASEGQVFQQYWNTRRSFYTKIERSARQQQQRPLDFGESIGLHATLWAACYSAVGSLARSLCRRNRSQDESPLLLPAEEALLC